MSDKSTPSFSNGKWHVEVKTVGEMMVELSRLPPTLPVQQGFTESADLVVFNHGQPTQYLGVDEGGTWP